MIKPPVPPYPKHAGRLGVPLAERAYQHLKNALIDGEYKAGERISVEELAKAIGASRQPVMDAIRRLEAEGLLTIIPQVGTLVATADAGEVRDFFRFLAIAEGHLGILAAERGSDEEMARLLTLVEAYPSSDCTERERIVRYRLHNRAFHGLIHEMARSPLVHQVAVGLWDKTDFYVNTLHSDSGFISREDNGIDEHRRIVQAILSRDGQAASEEIQRHIVAFANDQQRVGA